jgi:hypothetical protein
MNNDLKEVAIPAQTWHRANGQPSREEVPDNSWPVRRSEVQETAHGAHPMKATSTGVDGQLVQQGARRSVQDPGSYRLFVRPLRPGVAPKANRVDVNPRLSHEINLAATLLLGCAKPLRGWPDLDRAPSILRKQKLTAVPPPEPVVWKLKESELFTAFDGPLSRAQLIFFQREHQFRTGGPIRHKSDRSHRDTGMMIPGRVPNQVLVNFIATCAEWAINDSLAQAVTNPSSLHQGNEFSSDISGDGHDTACRYCKKVFPKPALCFRHQKVCPEQEYVPCKICKIQIGQSCIQDHLKEAHPNEKGKGKEKGNKADDKAKLIDKSIKDTEAKEKAEGDVVVMLAEEKKELTDVPAGLHSSNSPIVNTPKPPAYDEYGITTDPVFLASLQLGDEIHITEIPKAEAISAMWGMWWSQIKREVTACALDTAKGIEKFARQFPDATVASFNLVNVPLADDFRDLNLTLGEYDAAKTLSKALIVPDVVNAEDALTLTVGRSLAIANFSLDLTEWADDTVESAATDESSDSESDYMQDIQSIPAAFRFPTGRQFATDFWSLLFQKSLSPGFQGVIASTALYGLANVQESLIRGLFYVATNASADRRFVNCYSSNEHLKSASVRFETIMQSLNPTELWDLWYATQCITEAHVHATVIELGFDENELPLLKRKQEAVVKSQIIQLDSLLRITFDYDRRFLFDESCPDEIDYDRVPNNAFWNAARDRVVVDPRDSALLKFKPMHIKPAHLQEINIPRILTTEEKGRNFRLQMQSAFNGASVDAGLGEWLRNNRRFLPDTMSLMGQVIERRWYTSVFDMDSLYLK